MTAYPDAPYADPLAVGEAYQDYIDAYYFVRTGRHLHFTTTLDDQINIGETLERVEVKYDGPCTESGRLAVEIAEKTRAANLAWAPSGIYRKDNAIWYLQGNGLVAWTFAKVDLAKAHEEFKATEHEYGGTRRSFYLPLARANTMARTVWRFPEGWSFDAETKAWTQPGTLPELPTKVGQAPRAGLLPDVLAMVNKARVARGEQPWTRGPGFYDPLPYDERNE